MIAAAFSPRLTRMLEIVGACVLFLHGGIWLVPSVHGMGAWWFRSRHRLRSHPALRHAFSVPTPTSIRSYQRIGKEACSVRKYKSGRI